MSTHVFFIKISLIVLMILHPSIGFPEEKLGSKNNKMVIAVIGDGITNNKEILETCKPPKDVNKVQKRKIGESIWFGARLAKNCSKNKGIQNFIELEGFDDKRNIQKAKTVANAIVKRPEIIAVIGHASSGTTKATVKIYEKSGIPVLTPSSSSSVMFPESIQNGTIKENKNKRMKNVFRIAPSDELAQAPAIAYYSHKKLGKKRILLVAQGSDDAKDYSISLCNKIEKIFKNPTFNIKTKKITTLKKVNNQNIFFSTDNNDLKMNLEDDIPEPQPTCKATQNQKIIKDEKLDINKNTFEMKIKSTNFIPKSIFKCIPSRTKHSAFPIKSTSNIKELDNTCKTKDYQKASNKINLRILKNILKPEKKLIHGIPETFLTCNQSENKQAFSKTSEFGFETSVKSFKPDEIVYCGYGDLAKELIIELKEIYRDQLNGNQSEESPPLPTLFFSDGIADTPINPEGFQTFMAFPLPEIHKREYFITNKDLKLIQGFIPLDKESFEVIGYDSMLILAKAINYCVENKKILSRACLKNTLKIRSFKGVSESYSFLEGENQNSTYSIYIHNKEFFIQDTLNTRNLDEYRIVENP